ncbi:MAG: 4-hydroxy-tetrahydrodipicolinate synthase [Candidatus Endonucleobacter bathymodioli]|uniref:4-hydroxy-tetrahydrodipicolinate synthase n=1 Tax=Candidatus Endonucleibacter bathymodioli TaxID=539814 RepID=A0AA90NQZ2_9GAMM|nr:4-hydroxy-tetrahydrodipicolinate synthase [Candidatus Endonucleobacter bathymodioli]MDP0590301.1 4-hydroxy-tetrahydrodipicolinate synthase [Candidatus Endonucleobacter bathymodioli]
MITGSLVALVTPMHEDGEVDWERLHNLVELHISEKSDGIVVVGTTGESVTLTMQERCEIIRRTTDQVGGRIPVIAGTGTNSTRETIDASAEAKSLGVDACLLVTPYYNKPTQEGLYRHYKTVAGAVAIPHLLYNVPSRTAVDLLPETVARLAEFENIVGIKEATGILERGCQIRALCGKDFAIYSGDDATGMELMLQGANGVISVTSNVVPKIMGELCMLAMKGDRDAAEAINNRLNILHQKLFVEPNPIPVKWALQEMGLIDGGIRLPLTPLSTTCQAEISQVLVQLSLV